MLDEYERWWSYAGVSLGFWFHYVRLLGGSCWVSIVEVVEMVEKRSPTDSSTMTPKQNKHLDQNRT
jgi:hypothetical protein